MLDTDSDGSVSRSELSDFVTSMMDMSGAGDMATDPGLPAIIDTAFEHTDADHNNQISREEAAATQDEIASAARRVPTDFFFLTDIAAARRNGRLLHRAKLGRGHGEQRRPLSRGRTASPPLCYSGL